MPRNWSLEPLTDLVAHLTACDHPWLRDEMLAVERLATQVLGLDASRAPQLLSRLESVVLELSADLTDHLRKEEMVLFPAIQRMEAGEFLPRALPISSPITAITQDHARMGLLLAELRALTNGYATVEDECAATRELFERLAGLDRALTTHMRLEEVELFPRVLALAGLASIN